MMTFLECFLLSHSSRIFDSDNDGIDNDENDDDDNFLSFSLGNFS